MLRKSKLKKFLVLILVFSMFMTDKISNNLLVVFSMNNQSGEKTIEEIEEVEYNETFENVEDKIIEEEDKYNHIEEEQKELKKETRKFDDTTEEIKEIFDDESLNYGEEKESKEEAIDFSEYKELSVLEQLLYNKKDSAEINEEVIDIKDDIVLYYPIYVKDDVSVSINIGDKKITSPAIESAFIVSGSVKLYGNEGIIEGQNFKYPTFDLLNGEMTIEGGNIKGAYIGGCAIRAKDSDITINGGSVIGGDGENFYDDVGGDGGCAITATFSSDNNKIVFNRGSVIGGKGGSGYNGVEKSYGGFAFFDGQILYEDEELYKRGSRNEIGGGNGGIGIYIVDSEGSSNVIINEEGVRGGDGGNANRKVKKEVRYGKILPSKYDLRKYVDNGVERSVVASLHDQFQTGLCNTFSTVASAESYLLRYHPEYVEELGYNPNLQYTKNFPQEQRKKQVVGTKNVTLGTAGKYEGEIDLSEAWLAYFLRYHPADPLGNAKESKAVPTKKGKRYFNLGSSAIEMINFLSPFRGIPTEKVLSDDVMFDTVNNLVLNQADASDDDGIEEGDGITEQTDKVYEEDDSIERYAKYKPAVILKSAKCVEYADCDSKEEFLNGIKEAIYNNCAVVIGGHFVYGGGCSVYRRKEGEEHNVYMYMDSENGGGHAVSVVGWDDNFPASKFVEEKSRYIYDSDEEQNKGPTNDGALIVKQSTYGPMWTYIYYDSIFGSSWQYQVFEWELPDTYYDNMYYYDGGTAATLAQPLKYSLTNGNEYSSSPCVVFNLNKDQEVIKAVSFVSNDDVNIEDDSQKPRLQIFKSGNTRVEKVGDYLVDMPITLHKGLNFIELPNPIIGEANTRYVCFINYLNCPGNSYSAYIDPIYTTKNGERVNYIISSNVKYVTGAGESYLYRTHNNQFTKYEQGNFRIKMITSNNIDVTFDANGGTFGDNESLKLKRLYGNKILNEEVINPTYGKREFLGFSTDKDATEPNINSDTIFKSKTAVTYYAIYGKEEETTPEETTPEETTPEETKPEETTPEETTPEETTPEETTPEETKPEETKPEETTPEETKPEETTPEETTPEETTPEETKPEETTPEETTPEETKPEETTPEETKPEETTPEETKPEETKPEETTPEETKPEETTPEETTPDKVTPNETTKKATNTYYRGSSGGSITGGGGREGTNIIAPVSIDNLYRTKKQDIVKVEKKLDVRSSLANDIMVWNYDVVKNNWSLQVVGKNGKVLDIKNTLYIDTSSALRNKDKIPDVYLFDENGQLAKGFVDYADGNRYYFEQNDLVNIGKMVRNQWKEIGSGKWYYFDANGVMKRNTTTPDGYYVNEEGMYVSNIIVNTK